MAGDIVNRMKPDCSTTSLSILGLAEPCWRLFRVAPRNFSLAFRRILTSVARHAQFNCRRTRQRSRCPKPTLCDIEAPSHKLTLAAKRPGWDLVPTAPGGRDAAVRHPAIFRLVEISAVCRIEVRGVSTADLTSPRLWSTFGNSHTSSKTPARIESRARRWRVGRRRAHRSHRPL